jgi:Domain of unknown function (DUF4340)
MNPRNTAILFLVVVAVGAFVWLHEIRGADERAKQAEAEKRLFRDVEPDQITLITLRTKDGRDARLERVEGAWKLLAPLSFPADAATADGLASTLATVRSEAVIEDAGPLAEYGLAGPPKVHFRAGDRELALRVGDRSPVGSNTYVATGADSPIYAVASYRIASLDRTLDELRDKRVMRFDREAVVDLRAHWKGGSVHLVRDAQDPEAWRLVEPLDAAADGHVVSQALSDLEFLRATGFDDAPTPEVLARLEQPELAVELGTRANGKEGSVRLALGAPQKEERPARGSASDAVYRVPTGALQDLPRSVDGWRDKTVARFPESEARRFELAFHGEGGGESAVVSGRREGEAWKTEPETLKPEAVDNLLRALADLTGASIAAESMGKAERQSLGLAPPRLAIRVFGGPDEKDDAPLADVELGVADPSRGIAARRADRDTVYWLPYARSQQIPISLAALREHFVAAPPAPAGSAAPPPAAHSGEGGAPEAGEASPE